MRWPEALDAKRNLKQKQDLWEAERKKMKSKGKSTTASGKELMFKGAGKCHRSCAKPGGADKKVCGNRRGNGGDKRPAERVAARISDAGTQSEQEPESSDLQGREQPSVKSDNSTSIEGRKREQPSQRSDFQGRKKPSVKPNDLASFEDVLGREQIEGRKREQPSKRSNFRGRKKPSAKPNDLTSFRGFPRT